MGVERDAMGAAPLGTVVFDPTLDPATGLGADDRDPLGHLPLPPIDDLIESFSKAFIAVQDLTAVRVRRPAPQSAGGFSYHTIALNQGDLPYPKDAANTARQRNFISRDDVNAYFVGGDPARYPDGPYRQSRVQDSFYWTVYVATTYEGWDEAAGGFPDNDANIELGTTGVTDGGRTPIVGRPSSGPAYSLVHYEVVRDMAFEHGWTSDQLYNDFAGTVVHEVGHQFDGGIGKGDAHDDDLPWLDHVMGVASSNADEKRYPEQSMLFGPRALNRIRRHGGSGPPSP